MNRQRRRQAASQHPDSAIEPDHRTLMNEMMEAADEIWNKAARPRKVGLVFLVFPYDAPPDPLPDGKPRCNYISNGADRQMMASLFREMAARFEGAPEINTPTYRQ